MIVVRCTSCGKELQGQSSRIICCGCSNMTTIQDDDVSATTITEVNKVIKNVIASVDVAGYNPSKLKIYPDGTQYRAFVLLEYSDKEAHKIIMNRLMKDKIVYSKIKSTNAFKELEKEVDKSKKEDNDKSLSTIEKKINEKIS